MSLPSNSNGSPNVEIQYGAVVAVSKESLMIGLMEYTLAWCLHM